MFKLELVMDVDKAFLSPALPLKLQGFEHMAEARFGRGSLAVCSCWGRVL